MTVKRKLLRKPKLRKSLNCDPQWAGSFEGFVTNFLKTNYWKVESSMTYEDCVNEAYLVFLRLKERYSVQEPKHFMALFKTSLCRRFIDLASLDSELRSIESLWVEDEYKEFKESRDLVGSLGNDGEIMVALQQAPSEVVQVLKLLLNAPLEILDLARNAWKSNGHNESEGNNFINLALGRQKGTDSIGMVRNYFK